MALRIVTKEWETLYGIRPWLVETLVDSQRFSGHCYRTANWIDVGRLRGAVGRIRSICAMVPPQNGSCSTRYTPMPENIYKQTAYQIQHDDKKY